MHHPVVLSTLTAALAVLPAAQAAIYTKNSPVLQLDARSYERQIAKSNYTSVSLQSGKAFTPILSGPVHSLFQKGVPKLNNQLRSSSSTPPGAATART